MTEQQYDVDLDLADIQGNILTAYGRQGFPKGRFMLLNVRSAARGRAFVEHMRRKATTAMRWPSLRHPTLRPTGKVSVERPDVTINLAFTFWGLVALGVPTRTLRGMPDDFIDGMAARASILSDDATDWDPVWNQSETKDPRNQPHILVMLNARMRDDGTAVPGLQTVTDEIIDWCKHADSGVALCVGHRGSDERWQDLSAITREFDGKIVATPDEHFGFTDAISDPVFDGQVPGNRKVAMEAAVGQGKVDGQGNWSPLARGEFLLGWPDEAQEIPGAAMPLDFSRNGTFFAYRKLHQDVSGFHGWIDKTADQLNGLWRLGSQDEAKQTLMAKMAGRWQDGVPLMAASTFAEWQAFNAQYPLFDKDKPGELNPERARRLVDFVYRGDLDGLRCPMGAHTRRMNTRDLLDPHVGDDNPVNRAGSALNNRRRILRRGLPYGSQDDAHGEHGIVMLAVCANLSRQFEFVQQQWLNYGLDFNLGNDTCPLVGSHAPNARYVIAADPKSGNPPFIASGIPNFVEARGGDYFFMPSMTALRLIGMGLTDPT
ncbi:hypothetical protein VL15_14195 [Burkholderia cepacia]|uniref:Dyp-type peroxidase C-terminal domain-containing protein n=1 Tax=Burkholderia cepacia TaxID=292 RepID=A0A0J5X3D7_BURCE|nr:Dyp-type peroxidase [Burkholderia cepacia]KML57592.1 hypothetical protein VL15_14195 [Burkholderia cepacia]